MSPDWPRYAGVPSVDHLVSRWTAPAVLVGEAPGRDGARWCGVPFTSCRQLSGRGRPSRPPPSCSGVLSQLGLEQEVLLWNRSMLFAPGNRDPAGGGGGLFSGARDGLPGEGGVRRRPVRPGATGAPYIRHPSYGGAQRFAEGVRVAPGPRREPTSGEALGRLDQARLDGRPWRTGPSLPGGRRPYTASDDLLRPWLVDRPGGVRRHVRAAHGVLPAPARRTERCLGPGQFVHQGNRPARARTPAGPQAPTRRPQAPTARVVRRPLLQA